MDTSEVKIDQVYTKDEDPVALFVTITEDEARKIGAEGYVGPTKFGAKGKYERGKTRVTRAIYFPAGIPGAQFTDEIGKQIRDSVAVEGTVVPADIQFEKAEVGKAFPISGAASIRVVNDLHVMIDGKLVLQPSSFMRRLCPSCNAVIDVACKKCPFCGKQI